MFAPTMSTNAGIQLPCADSMGLVVRVVVRLTLTEIMSQSLIKFDGSVMLMMM